MSTTRTTPSLMSIRMENPATKFYHAINNAIKIIYNRKNFSSKFADKLGPKHQDQMGEILFQLYQILKKQKNKMEEGIIEIFREQGLEELFKEVLTLKTMRSALKSFAEDDLVGVIPEPFAFKKIHEMKETTQRLDVYETAFKRHQQLQDDSDEDNEVQDEDMLNRGMSLEESKQKQNPKINIDFEKLMRQIDNPIEEEQEGGQMMKGLKEQLVMEAPEALLKSEFIVNQKIKYVNEQIEKELKQLKSVMSKNGLSVEDLGEASSLPEMKMILKDEDDELEGQSPPKKDMTFSLF